MEFKIECPWCHQHYSVDDSFVGQNVECSVCGKVFTAKYPNDSTAEAALNPAENSIKQEKEDTSTISQDYSPKEPASERKKNIRKGFIIFVVFVFVLIALCGAYYSIALVKERKTEINLKNGIKAIDEHRYEDAVNDFDAAIKEAPYFSTELVGYYHKIFALTACKRHDEADAAARKALNLLDHIEKDLICKDDKEKRNIFLNYRKMVIIWWGVSLSKRKKYTEKEKLFTDFLSRFKN